ncbi:MAG: Ivy family c-type lysozyme inhibitor [Acetobacter papayae]|uniref:Ivy family c-type lysozyme inhibitor n=1 Tax=Acetobacter papayae TaxID=1076592 RepID=UPI0039EAEF9E
MNLPCKVPMMRFSLLAAPVAALMLSAPLAMAEDAPRTLSVDMQDATFAKRVGALFGKVEQPGWLKRATESAPVEVTMDGKPYTVLLSCKQHDCRNHQFVLMFNDKTMYGLRFETKDNSPQEELTWLNIGGGPESIDGKTILYAAITGSLYNHRAAFQRPQGQ